MFEQDGHRTVDSAEIGKRFADFGLTIDQSALKDLNRIRNDIEHFTRRLRKKQCRKLSLALFRWSLICSGLLMSSLMRALGDAWIVTLDVRNLYERELAECRKSFDGVDWRFNSMAEAALVCLTCKPHLVERKDTSKSSLEYADASCRACGVDISAQN